MLRIQLFSFGTHNQVFIAPPSIALKTRELDDATVNYNPYAFRYCRVQVRAFQLDNLFRNSCIPYRNFYLDTMRSKSTACGIVYTKVILILYT